MIGFLFIGDFLTINLLETYMLFEKSNVYDCHFYSALSIDVFE